MKPREGIFEVPVSLKEGDSTAFWVYARDGQGRLIETDTPEFAIRHGLVPSAPPIPHTLFIELVGLGGRATLDPIFPKGTPLPAETTKMYRAAHALIPSDPTSDLAIKIWEGEYMADPGANDWVGHILLPHDDIGGRGVPEGTEIEVTIHIDASRLITVEAFVPRLNQHFSNKLYMPQRDEQDFSQLSQSVLSDIQTYRRRLDDLERTSYGTRDESTRAEIETLHKDLDRLEASTDGTNRGPSKPDPDDAKRIVEDSKSIRGRLSLLESRTEGSRSSLDYADFTELVETATEVTDQFGSSLEKENFKVLKRELERAASKGDDKAVRRICEEISELRWRVLFKQDWFWREIFDSLCRPGTPFVDHAAANRIIAKGRQAISAGDGAGLREAVRGLWDLQPKDDAEAARERAMRSGLRRF